MNDKSGQFCSQVERDEIAAIFERIHLYLHLIKELEATFSLVNLSVSLMLMVYILASFYRYLIKVPEAPQSN